MTQESLSHLDKWHYCVLIYLHSLRNTKLEPISVIYLLAMLDTSDTNNILAVIYDLLFIIFLKHNSSCFGFILSDSFVQHRNNPRRGFRVRCTNPQRMLPQCAVCNVILLAMHINLILLQNELKML